jgi:GMP synthase (glutamine-hydrolysing)
VRRRIEAEPLGEIDLDDWSGIFVGGGPFNASDPIEKKSAVQRRVEAEIAALLDEVVARDFPSSAPATASAPSARMRARSSTAPTASRSASSRSTRTPPGATTRSCGPARPFAAFVGHKEAITVLPPSATLLVRGEACPVQMFRVGERLRDAVPPGVDVEGITPASSRMPTTGTSRRTSWI